MQSKYTILGDQYLTATDKKALIYCIDNGVDECHSARKRYQFERVDRIERIEECKKAIAKIEEALLRIDDSFSKVIAGVQIRIINANIKTFESIADEYVYRFATTEGKRTDVIYLTIKTPDRWKNLKPCGLTAERLFS